jgi:hypothetical protein
MLAFPTHITLFGCHEKKLKGEDGWEWLSRERVCHGVLYYFVIVHGPPFGRVETKESSV